MSPDSQRIAIAEACGIVSKDKWGSLYKTPRGILRDCPDYLADLNAMHEAEQILWRMDWSHRYAFNDHLANTIRGRTVNRNEWDAETLLDATAEKRAEAFLKTIGKWEESK